MRKIKQVYKITYPTNKIYIGKDAYGSFRYFGSPDMELVSNDFLTLPKDIQMDYTIRKAILWESETANMRITNDEEANRYITREYRKGWEL